MFTNSTYTTQKILTDVVDKCGLPLQEILNLSFDEIHFAGHSLLCSSNLKILNAE
jgi:hypothetical protein